MLAWAKARMSYGQHVGMIASLQRKTLPVGPAGSREDPLWHPGLKITTLGVLQIHPAKCALLHPVFWYGRVHGKYNPQ